MTNCILRSPKLIVSYNNNNNDSALAFQISSPSLSHRDTDYKQINTRKNLGAMIYYKKKEIGSATRLDIVSRVHSLDLNYGAIVVSGRDHVTAIGVARDDGTCRTATC